MASIKKNFKKVMSLLLALTMVLSTWGSVDFITEATDTATDERVTYTVDTEGDVDYLYVYNKEASSGPVTMTYTVDYYKRNGGEADNNGIVATADPVHNLPYVYSCGSYRFADKQNFMMQEGYTYSITMSLDANKKIAFTGYYVAPNGTRTEINTTDHLNKGPVGSGGAATYFGVYLQHIATVSLSNVSFTDANGKDLGVTVNNKPSYIAPETDTSAYPSTYTVDTEEDVDYLYVYNKKPSSGPVTMTYTVDYYKRNGGEADNNGIVATADPVHNLPYAYTGGSYRFADKQNFMMQEGYTYSITMSLDASKKIAFTGFYVAPDGTKTEINTTDHLNKGPVGSGGAATYFGVYLQHIATVSLSNVSFTDANGKDLGVTVNNKPSYIARETDAPKYTVDTQKDVDYLYVYNNKASTGPVTMTYTVDYYKRNGGEADNNGIVATADPKHNLPYVYTGGSYRFTNTQNFMMQEGYTYSITMNLDASNKIAFTGFCVAPDGTRTVITTTHLDKGPAGNGGRATHFGVYLQHIATVSLSNVSFTDAKGNDLGVQSNKDVTIMHHVDVDDATINTYNVEIRGVNSFLSNAKAGSSEVGTEYYMNYTVEKATALPVQLGVIGTKDYSVAFPYIDVGMLKFNYAENAPTLLEEGATYHMKFTVQEGGYEYNIYYIKGDEVKNVYFRTSHTEDKDGVTNTLDNLGYFGLWFGDGTKEVSLTDVTCYDSEGNDLGLWLADSKGLLYSKEELKIQKDTEIEQCYDIEVKNKENVAIGNIRLPETSKMYFEYKVESADYNLTQEGVFMSSSIMGGYPYTKGHLNYNNYDEGNTDSSMLLDVGAEYIICVERKETGFVAKVFKTKDGVTTLSIFDSMARPSWSEDTQYAALWFGDFGNGGIASFKLTNFKCYDENKNELGVQCNKEAKIVPKITIVHHVDVDESKISKYNVMIGAVNTFLCNAKTIGAEVGTEYYMTYTVDRVTALPLQLGVIGTEDYSIAFPYIDVGMLKFNYAENAPTLLEEGATYHIKFTVTKSGYDYNIYYVKGDEVKNVFFTKSHTEDKDGVANTLDNLGYFGLWFGDGTDLVSLTDVSCFDGEGNDLGIWFAESKGISSKEKIEVKTNKKVGQYYNIEVNEQENVAIGNVKFPETSKMYIEYKVESADYNLTQEGIFMSNTIMGGYPYVKGHMNFNNYEEGNKDSSMLLDVGARYLICIERKEAGFTAQVLKSKDGITTARVFKSMYRGAWNEDVRFFALWFGDFGNGGIASFKLTDFKCYDENNNNLGVQCNKNVPITKRGTVEDYGLCEATYYCEANGSYFVLDKNQKLKFVNNDSVSEGKYTVSLPNISVVLDGTKRSYDYLYSKITDSEGQEYVRLYNYKITFETGTDSKVETQSFSTENGYFATRPENPVLKGYDFLGWYMADGTEYNFDNMVTESVTLYAKYSNGGGIIFAAEDEVLQPINTELVLCIVSGAVILLGGCVACILMIKRGKKSGRDSQK